MAIPVHALDQLDGRRRLYFMAKTLTTDADCVFGVSDRRHAERDLLEIIALQRTNDVCFFVLG